MASTSYAPGGSQYLPLDGSKAMTGDLDLGRTNPGNQIKFRTLELKQSATKNQLEVWGGNGAWRGAFDAGSISTQYFDFNLGAGELRCARGVTAYIDFHTWKGGGAYGLPLRVLSGNGVEGWVCMPNLPTSDPADGSSKIWSDGGVLTLGT